MTSELEGSRGFETRLLETLTAIDAARPIAPARDHQAHARHTGRPRRSVVAIAAVTVVALGGAAVAAASGLFDSAPSDVKQIFTGLDAHGSSVDAADAVRIGVIDDHVAYAAPTSGGGFCLYFGDNPDRSGPTGGSCISRDAAPDEAVFSVLWGSDGGLLFGRVGTREAQQITATFPRSGDAVTARVADSGFFAVEIPDRALRSLMAVTLPDPEHPGKNVRTKDGGPVLGFQLDRVPEISAVALDGQGRVVAHGVPVIEPDLAPSPTADPTQ